MLPSAVQLRHVEHGNLLPHSLGEDSLQLKEEKPLSDFLGCFSFQIFSKKGKRKNAIHWS